MENMYIYEAGRSVPPQACRSFNNGKFSGTDINPMWRIKKLTEIFGPAGIGWYTDVLSERSEALDDSTTIAVVDLNLYVRDGEEWSKPIYGTGGNTLRSETKRGVNCSDEGYKMAYTDALSVACKALGIGADVYFERDRTKYTDADADAAEQAPPPPEQTPPPPAQTACSDRITAEQVRDIKMLCSADEIRLLCAKYKIERLADMRAKSASAMIQKLLARREEGAQRAAGDAGTMG